MKDFYRELETKPDATLEEIKENYRRLAKEYHPDRLPPGTPDKARQYIEEKFKSIQEAYTILSDPVKRKAYDSQRASQAPQTKGSEYSPGLKAKPSYSTQDGSTWPFDPDKIQKAAKEIERRKESIEVNYNQKIEQVKSELRRNLISIGIKEEDARVDYAFLTKDENIRNCLFSLFLGFLAFLGGWGAIGTILVIIAFAFAWSAFSDRYSKAQVETAKSFQERAKSKIALHEKEKSAELTQLQLYYRSRIDYFKSLSLESLSPEFISGLSGEDQLFLLTAIKERADAEKLKEDLKLAAGVAVGIGILAVLFGLGGGFYPH
ncbi:J domain-containing protein [Synechococcus sp. H70.2]|uniref:J domain-containing protein n=1 Tax=unclassified Synechococcus TaxID=2626047 RepID=UPI0039C30140